MNKGDYAFLIASPEKALCDLIANSSKVILRYMKDVETYLEQDIRRKKIVHLTQLGIKRCQESVVKLIEIENSILENWGKEKTEKYLDETEEYNCLMKKGLADLCRSN